METNITKLKTAQLPLLQQLLGVRDIQGPQGRGVGQGFMLMAFLSGSPSSRDQITGLLQFT